MTRFRIVSVAVAAGLALTGAASVHATDKAEEVSETITDQVDDGVVDVEIIDGGEVVDGGEIIDGGEIADGGEVLEQGDPDLDPDVIFQTMGPTGGDFADGTAGQIAEQTADRVMDRVDANSSQQSDKATH